jgi:predicted transcriptional regulator
MNSLTQFPWIILKEKKKEGKSKEIKKKILGHFGTT